MSLELPRPEKQVIPLPHHSPLLESVAGRIERDGRVEGYVPLGLINDDGLPVDETHVAGLITDIRAHGLDIPLGLAEIPGESYFHLTDGLHRYAAYKRLLNEEGPENYGTVLATIKLNCTLKDVIAARTLASAPHLIVKWSRMIHMIRDSYSLQDWAERTNPRQALYLAGNPDAVGQRYNATQDEIGQIRNWGRMVSEQWRIKPAEVYKALLTAEHADPALINAVREHGSRQGRLEALSPAHLYHITSHVRDYALQRLIADAVLENSLTAYFTQVLAEAAATASSSEEVAQLIAKKVWRASAIDANVPTTPPRYQIEEQEAQESFQQLLRGFRERLGISRNRLAYTVGIDPSYLTRIEHGDREPPRKYILDAIVRELRLNQPERNKLLTKAGYSPEWQWDETLEEVASVLNNPNLTAEEIAEYRQMISMLSKRWTGQTQKTK